MNLWVKGALAAVGLMVVGGGAAWFFLGRAPQGPANPWYQGAEGYQLAQQQALALGYPLLYVLDAPRCRRCGALDKKFWQSGDMAGPLAKLVKVRLNPGKGDGSEQILRRFPKVATPPGIYIQQPGQSLKPVKIVVDIDQIWMPGKTWQRGFYMPLSAAGFEAVIHATLALQDPALDNAPLD